MARSTNDILFRWLADTKSLKKGTRSARGDLKSTGKVADKATIAMGGLQKAFIAAGGAMAIRELGEFIFDAAQMATAADVVSDSFEKIFQESSPKLRNELERTRLMVGLNSLEFEELLLKTGNLATGFGATSTEAANLSSEMFTVAADLAAFTGNADMTGEALHALNRALVGEFDPLEQFVGGIKASTVAAKALELGLADSTAELTDQDKAIALLALVADRGAAAIGSLAEQEGSLQLQTAEATARLEDMKIMIGRELTPAVLEAATGTLNFAKGLDSLVFSSNDVTNSLGRFSIAVAEVAKFIVLNNPPIFLYRKAIEALGTAFNNTARAIGGFVTSLTKIPTRIALPKFPSFSIPNPFRGFAQGGTIQPGQTSLVGENGPELISPRGGAHITPSHRSNGTGAGVTVNVTFSGVVGDPTAVAEQIQDLLEQYTRTNVSF